MKISVITLFPEIIRPSVEVSIINNAQKKGLVEIELVQLRDFAIDSHGTVDDRPYGGGAGMVLMASPVKEAISKIKDQRSPLRPEASRGTAKLKTKVILTSARGVSYSQQKAEEYAKLDHLIIIAGHYESVDERALEYVDEEVSVGDFVLTGGELPAAMILDSVVRLFPGVLKKEDATENESFGSVSLAELEKAAGTTKEIQDLQNAGHREVRLLEYPHYTRPEQFDGESVPDILLSGNHAEIRKWRLQQSYSLTIQRRPDLLRPKAS